MKNILIILKFELANYFKSKTYVVSTLLICILAAGIMFVPRIVDAFSGGGTEESAYEEDDVYESDDDEDTDQDEDGEQMGLYDPQGVAELSTLQEFFSGSEFVLYDSVEELKEAVSQEEVEAGFGINSLTDYDYYVLNKSMTNSDEEIFNEYMLLMVKMDYCEKNNLNPEEFLSMEYTEINVNEQILGKDSTENYWYCYALVIIIFMLIIMYGTTIASSVTNEKSNRSIEILVTSTDSTALLFGKVFAGAVATIVQVGLILAALLGGYQYNKSFWSINLGMFLDIPANVIVTFAIFGLGGFLVYAFMYGALGALVSKIEDLNKSAGTAQMVVTIVYIVVLCQLYNVDGIVMKVCSFLPISSYSAMFARVAMGNVATWEVVVSAVILYASVVVMGIVGGKIFRSSTLRYGNPIKLSHALKGLRKREDQ
jgi:ABC-2 type transport system permease protein